MLERDPVKLLEWVAGARSSVLDRIEDGQTAEWRTTRIARCFNHAGQSGRIAERQWLSVKG
jgi:hypothetical protein